MKNSFLIISALLVVFLQSCTSSSSGSDGNSGGGASNTFTATVNGTAVVFTQVTAQRQDVVLSVTATDATNTKRMNFAFNPNGNLISAYYNNAGQSYYAHYYSSTNTFTFNLTTLNVANKQVVADFNGTFYRDSRDLTSNTITVSGNFSQIYQLLTPPPVTNPHVSFSAGNYTWFSTHSNLHQTLGGSFNSNEFTSDKPLKISFVFSPSSITLGNHPFTANSTDEYMIYSVYNPTTDSYDDYTTTSGSFNITSKQIYSTLNSTFLLEGTFTLNAVNPNNSNQTIHITDGSFKNIFGQ
jgi:hypothetical protein